MQNHKRSTTTKAPLHSWLDCMCLNCGIHFKGSSKGRRGTFCTDRCKMQWHRQEAAKREKAARNPQKSADKKPALTRNATGKNYSTKNTPSKNSK